MYDQKFPSFLAAEFSSFARRSGAQGGRSFLSAPQNSGGVYSANAGSSGGAGGTQQPGGNPNPNFTSTGGQRSSHAETGKVSAAAVENFIKDITFPASKDDLIRQAQTNGAPEHVLSFMRQLPSKEYNNVIDVAKAVSEAKEGENRR